MNPEKILANYNPIGEVASGVAADPAPEEIELSIPPDCAGLRLDQALARLLPEYSRSRLQQWVRDGGVTVDGEPASVKQKVAGGETVSVEPEAAPEVSAYQPEAIPLEILHEDDAIMVINKPAGLVTHPGSGNWSGTLLNALLHHAPQVANVPRAGIVHRLDKNTTGLLVVAKTLQAQTDLVRQLQARSVKREYLAIVEAFVISDGTVEAPIGRNPTQRIKMAVVGSGKQAVTHYKIIERLPHHTLLQCSLETGRTHQIRVHMQQIGHSLAGDATYSGKQRIYKVKTEDEQIKTALQKFARQALHATRLELVHPQSGERVKWEAPMPADMVELLKALRLDS
ncbi:MAG: 23S rRNA pseudouridine(1911/1915/1917) synthase RluD [Burkholderiales bacterium]